MNAGASRPGNVRRLDWATPSRVVLIGGFLIGFAEIAAIVSIASWSSLTWLSQISWYALAGSFSVVGLVWWYGGYYGYLNRLNLVRRSSNHHLTWLYLHWIYIIVGLANVIVILVAFTIVAFKGAPLTLSSEAWMFYVGGTILIANYYSYIVLKVIGQGYEGLRGACLIGVAALGGVAAKMLASRKRKGLGYLSTSLRMLTSVSQFRGFYPTELDQVFATVQSLTEADRIPFAELETLARSLNELPDLGSLPDSFANFLNNLKWPRGFERLNRREPRSRIWYLLPSLVTLLGIVLGFYPNDSRNLLASLGQSFVADLLVLLSALVSGTALISALIPGTYAIAWRDIRFYGKSKDKAISANPNPVSHLTGDEIRNLCQKLKDSRIFEVSEVEEFWKKTGLSITDDDWIAILSQLSDIDVFRWLPFISTKLKEVASSSPEFVSLVSKMVEKTKRDMTAGWLLNSLEEISMSDPDLGLELFRQTYTSSNFLVVELSGFFLAGHIKREFPAALEFIKTKFQDATPSQRIALIRGLASGVIAFGRLDDKLEVLALINKASQCGGTARPVAVDAYFQLFKLNNAECGKVLIELSASRDGDIQFAIARNLWSRNIANPEIEWKIIENLAKSENEAVLSLLVQPIWKIALERPTEVLRMFHDWFETGLYFKIHDVDFPLSKLGEAEPVDVLKTIESWIGNSSRVEYHIPAALSTIFDNNPIPLIERLESWIGKGGKFREVGLKTLLEILSHIREDNATVLDRSWKIIQNTAEASKINIAKTLRGETSRIWQCRLILEELLKPRKPLDYSKIIQNLDQYPTVRDFVGREWFERMGKEANKTHDLLTMLSLSNTDFGEIQSTLDMIRKEEDELKRAFLAERIRLILGPDAYLTHLDKMLRQIKGNEKGTGDFRNGLENEEQFWQTVSEIEIGGTIRANGLAVEFKPAVDGAELDAKVIVDANEILIEVINPEMWRTLRLVSGGASVPNRIEGKLAEEYEKHLRKSQGLKTPVLIAIDLSRSEIDEESVIDYFNGSLQYTFMTNKETGEIVEGYWSRADDSMSQKNPERNIISGAIAYKSPLGNDLKVHLQGRIILNENALNKLSESEKKLLENAVFG